MIVILLLLVYISLGLQAISYDPTIAGVFLVVMYTQSLLFSFYMYVYTYIFFSGWLQIHYRDLQQYQKSALTTSSSTIAPSFLSVSAFTFSLSLSLSLLHNTFPLPLINSPTIHFRGILFFFFSLPLFSFGFCSPPRSILSFATKHTSVKQSKCQMFPPRRKKHHFTLRYISSKYTQTASSQKSRFLIVYFILL